MKKIIYPTLFLLMLNTYFLEAQYSWIQKADFPGVQRIEATGFSLNGKGYMGGGYDIAAIRRSDFWEWTQATNTWVQKADLPGGCYSAVAFSIDNVGYFGTGVDVNGNVQSNFWKYNPSTNTWSSIANFPKSRAYAVGFSMNGYGYVGLGQDSLGNWLKDFWRYDPINNTWQAVADFGGTARNYAVAFVIDTVAYVGSGQESNVGGFRSDFWKYTASTNSWIQIADIPTPRRWATAFSINQKGYAGTGMDATGKKLKDYWEYNPTNNQWLQIADCSNSTRWRGIGYSINNRGYVLLGAGVSGNNLIDHWEYGPPTIPLSANAIPISPSCNGTCNGSATVTASNGNQPYHYLWLSNNDTTATTNNLCAGKYIVRVTDAFSSTVFDTVSVTAPAPVLVTIKADTTIMCANDSAQICTTSPYSIYHWNTGQSTQCITAKKAANYYVTVTDNNNCTAVSNHLAINVHPLPPVSISVNRDTLKAAYNAVTYQWYLNNNPINKANSNIYITNEVGSYSVAVTDTFGCRAMSNPVVISGIENLKEDGTIVFPNPLKDGNWQVFVGNSMVGSDILIFDYNGKLVYKSVIKSTHSEIEFGAAKGIYLMRIISNENSSTRKLIKL